MPLVKAQCENCSGILTVDSSKRAAICPYCGTPYVVQDAINHYSTHIENLHADVVNIQNGESKQDMLKNAETYYRLGQFNWAEEAYKKVIERYPDEPQGWWGVYKTALRNFVYFHDLERKYKQYATTAMKLHDYSDEYNQIWSDLVVQYGKELHTNKKDNCVWLELSPKDIEIMLYANIEDTNNPHLKIIQTSTINNYRDSFISGDITFFSLDSFFHSVTIDFWQGEEIQLPRYVSDNSVWQETCKLEDFPAINEIINTGYQNARRLYPDDKYRKIEYLKENVQYISGASRDFGVKTYNNLWATCIDRDQKKNRMAESCTFFPWDKGYKIVFLLGKTIVVESMKYDCDWHQDRPSYQILLTKDCLSPDDIKSLEVAHWKKEGRCAHCGGNLVRGLFSTKCDSCGKKKDY